MSFGKTNQIRAAIRQAKRNEDDVDALRDAVRISAPRLHGAIHLPSHNAEKALGDFVIRYLDHAPNCMDALGGLTQQAGIFDYAGIFLDIAADFFLQPPDIIARYTGLRSLVNQAYLVHRLIEEVNDRVLGRCGIPLAPIDMTRANLVMHQFIGEPYANDLDFLVHYTTELHLDKEYLMDNAAFHRYVREHQSRNWQMAFDRWPCLAEDLSIEVYFGGESGLMENVIPEAIH